MGKKSHTKFRKYDGTKLQQGPTEESLKVTTNIQVKGKPSKTTKSTKNEETEHSLEKKRLEKDLQSREYSPKVSESETNKNDERYSCNEGKLGHFEYQRSICNVQSPNFDLKCSSPSDDNGCCSTSEFTVSSNEGHQLSDDKGIVELQIADGMEEFEESNKSEEPNGKIHKEHQGIGRESHRHSPEGGRESKDEQKDNNEERAGPKSTGRWINRPFNDIRNNTEGKSRGRRSNRFYRNTYNKSKDSQGDRFNEKTYSNSKDRHSDLYGNHSNNTSKDTNRNRCLESKEHNSKDPQSVRSGENRDNLSYRHIELSKEITKDTSKNRHISHSSENTGYKSNYRLRGGFKENRDYSKDQQNYHSRKNNISKYRYNFRGAKFEDECGNRSVENLDHKAEDKQKGHSRNDATHSDNVHDSKDRRSINFSENTDWGDKIQSSNCSTPNNDRQNDYSHCAYAEHNQSGYKVISPRSSTLNPNANSFHLPNTNEEGVVKEEILSSERNLEQLPKKYPSALNHEPTPAKEKMEQTRKSYALTDRYCSVISKEDKVWFSPTDAPEVSLDGKGKWPSNSKDHAGKYWKQKNKENLNASREVSYISNTSEISANHLTNLDDSNDGWNQSWKSKNQSKKRTSQRNSDNWNSSYNEKQQTNDERQPTYAPPGRASLEYFFSEPPEGNDTDWINFEKHFKSNNVAIFTKVKEVNKDLFTIDDEFSLAHCVAEDMNMGSGIAVEFRRTFKNVDMLLNQRQRQGGLAVLEDKKRYIYYLVTKTISSGKPTYNTLWSALKKMRDHMENNSINKLAIPRIGCGLDRLEWSIVKPMLESLFSKLDVEIMVCNFQQDEQAISSSRSSLRKCKVVNAPYPITSIEAETIIIYFASKDGEPTQIMKDLNQKFNHSKSFSSAEKNLGSAIRYEDKISNYLLYGCIVRNKWNDPFDFEHFGICLKTIQSKNKTDQFYYVGFQKVDDPLTNEKILNLMKHSLRDVEIYCCGYPPNDDPKDVSLDNSSKE